MATDRDEILRTDELGNNFNINQYTIRYDNNIKRFFKGFMPKLGWGALTSVGVIAGLGIVGLATGGIALGAGLTTAITVGNIASYGVTAGALSQGIYSGVVYGKNLSKTRFKSMGLGGVKNSHGAIEVVLENENKAREYAMMLDIQKNTNTFTLENRISRKDLKNNLDMTTQKANEYTRMLQNNPNKRTFSEKILHSELVQLANNAKANAEKYEEMLERLPNQKMFVVDEKPITRSGLKRLAKNSRKDFDKYSQFLDAQTDEDGFVLSGQKISRKKLEKLAGENLDKSNQYRSVLQENPNLSEYVVESEEVSRRTLKKLKKEHEQISYHGLKYILEQGLYYTDKINYINKKSSKTDLDIANLEKYYSIMDRIAECTKELASKRQGFNPYKKLIVDSMRKGCLLGYGIDADEQNKKILMLKNMKDKDLSFKQYSNMYELDLNKDLIKEREQTIKAETKINEQYNEYLDAINLLIRYDGDVSKLNLQQRRLVEQIKNYKSYVALIGTAELIAQSMPRELEKNKLALNQSIENMKKAMLSKNREDSVIAKMNLDELVEKSQEDINSAFIARGKKINQEELDSIRQNINELTAKYNKAKNTIQDQREKLTAERQKTFKAIDERNEAWFENVQAYKTQVQELNERADKIIEAFDGINLKNKPIISAHIDKVTHFKDSKNLTDEEFGQYKTSLNYLYTTLQALNKQLLAKEQAKHATATKLALNKRSQNKELQNENIAQQNTINDLNKENVDLNEQVGELSSKAIEASKRAEKLKGELEAYEQENKHLGDEITILQQNAEMKNNELNKALEENAKQKDKLTRVTNIARNKANKNKQLSQDLATAINSYTEALQENKETRQKLRQAEDERDRAIAGWYEVEQEADTSYSSAKQLENQLAKQTDSLNRSKKSNERLKKTNTEYEKALKDMSNKFETSHKELMDQFKENATLKAELNSAKNRNQKLENENREVSSNYSKMSSTVDQLYEDLYNTQKELENIKSDNKVNLNAVEDLSSENINLKKTVKDLQQEVEDNKNSVAEYKAHQDYNRDFMKALHDLANLADKVEAHCDYTEEKENKTNSHIEALRGYVDVLRQQDFNKYTIDELREKRMYMKTLYDSEVKQLAKVSDKKLKQLTEDWKRNHKNKDYII